MSDQVAGLRSRFRNAELLPVLLSFSSLFLLANAFAGEPAAEGTRALLTVSLSIEGAGEKPFGKKDEVVRWSTKRSYKTSIELIAEKPEQMSLNAVSADGAGAVPQEYTDLAKQAEACGQDQACLMRMAMQMANSEQVKKAKDVPKRYQLWKADDDAVPTQSSVSYEDKSYSLFYVSGPEIVECTLTAPLLSPELKSTDAGAQATIDQYNRDLLVDIARAFVVETDAETGTSKLNVPGLSAGFGDEKCAETIGGRTDIHHRSTNGTLLPAGELKVPLVVEGKGSGIGMIGSGSQVIEGNVVLTDVPGAFGNDLTVPLKATVNWELKKL
jgi:hypothetical protein